MTCGRDWNAAVPDEDRWEFRNFGECLDAWIDQTRPDDDLRLIVTQWVMARHDDPFEGVSRQAPHPNMWFARIRDTYRPPGTMVTCSYWVFADERVVYCDRIQTLNLPI